MLTKIKIINQNNSFESLSLAPMTVRPLFQRKGIGKKLINEAHKLSRQLGFSSIVVLGHEDYYPIFGYDMTSKYNIKLPFAAPEKNCMIISLTENVLKGVSGIVEYPKEFFE